MKHPAITCLLLGALGLSACGGGNDDDTGAGPSADAATATLGAELLPPTASDTLEATLRSDDAQSLSADLLPPA